MDPSAAEAPGLRAAYTQKMRNRRIVLHLMHCPRPTKVSSRDAAFLSIVIDACANQKVHVEDVPQHLCHNLCGRIQQVTALG